MKVGFIGLGRMGQGMAGRILAAGHDLLVSDPVPGQTASLEKNGAAAVASPAAATVDRDVVISMLPSDQTLKSVLQGDGGLLKGMSTSCIHMASGTHGVPAINAAAQAHKDAHQTFIACPVLGRPDLAAQGLLKLVPAGPADAIEKVLPLLEVIGQQTFRAGDSPQAAAAVKIANNFVLGCAIETMGEALSLVEKLGVEPKLFFEVMTQGLFAAPAYEVYGKMIVDKNWDSHGATALIGVKDADLALEAAATVDVPLPSAHIWRDYLKSAIERGEGHLDWAVMALEQARASGLEK
ncbi:MAG: NAD(P)-dependent oxidoreductase [Gammaproteobacteria bacterium]|nr:NAD(P)-dependent oxidoreductase [Gammaproteobacteria bacterium]MDH3434736.1 NAD(P)-dependent oxidoreductase [Gammaproteobacteria bacterium]